MSWTSQDPGRGDPARITTLANNFGTVASAASQAQSQLQLMHDQMNGTAWSGTAATAFKTRIGSLPDHLSHLATSYQSAADGLHTYSATVQSIKDQAAAANKQLASAQADHSKATAAQKAYTPPTDPTTGQPVAGAVNPHDAAVNTAQTSITKAQNTLNSLVEQRKAADVKVNNTLHTAHEQGMKNDSAWSHFCSDVGDTLGDIGNGLENFGKDVLHGVEHGAEFLGDMGKYYIANPDKLAQLALNGLELYGAAAMMTLGAGGEALGVALDATGVGAIAGVPINVASAALMAAGAGVGVVGATQMGSNLEGAASSASEQMAEEEAASEPTVTYEESGSKGAWNKNLNKPEPNSTYDVDGKVTFKTDDLGRTTDAETTLTRDSAPADRNGYQQTQAGKPDRLEGDQGGHIIGSRFGGPGEQINLTAMKSSLNGPGANSYYEMEGQWASWTKEGKSVDVSVNVQYDGASSRPTSYIVKYSVDGGKPITRFFDNS